MKPKTILKELKEHIPFTLVATLTAVLIIVFVLYGIKKQIPTELFEIFHPLHVIASSIVTTAIFYKYKQKIIPAILVGISGSIIIGSLSDIIFPYLGGNLLNLQTSFHLPLFESTTLILSVALMGSLIGIITKKTQLPHYIHVFLSVFASLFYLLNFSQAFNLIHFIGAFFVVFIAVIVPCCLSDIVFPFLFIKNEKSKSRT